MKQIPGNATTTIVLSFTPQAATAYSGVLSLTTDDNNAPTRTISLSGIGLKGALAATPWYLDFGIVHTQHDTTLFAVLKNTGTAAVTVNSVTITSATGAYSNANITMPHTIAAGDSISVAITFAPSVEGPQSGTLVATLADATTISVPLFGYGVEAPKETVTRSTGQHSGISFTIAPNPAHDRTSIRLQLDRALTASIRIYDVTGHEVHAAPIGSLKTGETIVGLETNNLTNGNYFVVIEGSDGEIAEGRLVIDR